MKLLIVDDEIQIRTGIKEGIDWLHLGFDEVLIAEDADEGLAIFRYKRPEIVMTDIRMPGMDGLAMSEMMMQIEPATKIVILSGYSEFEYAKRGLQLGAVEYELKPIKIKNLIALITRLKREIIEASERRQEVRKYIETYKNKFLADVLDGAIIEKKSLEEGFVKWFGMEVSSQLLCLMIAIDRGCEQTQASPEQQGDSLYRCISRSLELQPRLFRTIVFEKSSRQFLIVCKPEREAWHRSEFRTPFSGMLDQINRELETAFACTASMAVSSSGTISDIAEMRSQAERAIRNKLYEGKRALIYYESAEHDADGVTHYSIEEETVNAIRFHLAGFQLADIANVIDREFARIRDNRCTESRIQSLCLHLIHTLIHASKEMGIDFEVVFKNRTDFYDGHTNCDTLDDYRNWVLSAYSEVIGKFEELKGIGQNAVIRRAVAYIKQNYDQELTIEMLAELAGITPNYFSHLFKKEIDVSFSEYLNMQRIEGAKKLLRNSNLLVYEIAGKVGFGDYKYFTQVFKKFAACSPKQYRNRLSVEQFVK